MNKIAFYTLGCRANQYQTEVLKSQAVSQGLRIVNFRNYADEYTINTCTVTEDADRKSRQSIRRALRQNPKAKISVTGCYAKLAAEELKKLFPEIILTPLIPLSTKWRGGNSDEVGEGVRIRSNLMIQDGCEHFCSYCIVPYARGKIKSKPVEQILEETSQLVEAGAREIVLTGINLGAYQFELVRVIESSALVEDLYRIRLSSLEPMYINKKLIDVMAETPKVCKHLHIPLQSGDNGILSAMNRNYTREEYLDLIYHIRSKVPDCGISTDIMVGFPGEGEKEFQNTVDLINQIKFSRMHIFAYSKRKETRAENFPNQIDEKTKKHRNKLLHHLRTKYMIEFAHQYLNKKAEILVEQKGEGLTNNYIRTFYPGKEDEIGKIRRVTVKEIKENFCLAS